MRAPRSLRCRECGTLFHRKPSQLAKVTTFGILCSIPCFAKAKERLYLGENNPNFRGRNFDEGGYRLISPAASLKLGLGKIKEHHAVVFGQLGIDKLPQSTNVHHRDCNILNNDPSNLQLMSGSDHRWIHKQYGSAALKAIAQGKVPLKEAVSWSDDPTRAWYLLVMDSINQGVVHKHLADKHGPGDYSRALLAKPVSVTFELTDDITTKEATA